MARVGALATELCGSATGADGVRIKAFKLVSGKRAAGFKLTATFRATTGKRGNLAVRGKGVLEPAPTTSTMPTSTTAPSSSTSTTTPESSTSTTKPDSSTSTSIVGPTSTTVSSTTVTSTTIKTPTTVTTIDTSTTEPTSSTSTTSTSSSTTTTTLDSCAGAPDGFLCALSEDDGNPCTNEVCSGGVCAHPARPIGSACGAANGSPCDATDTCENVLGVGFVCQDRKSTSFCPGPIAAQLPCNTPGFLMCDGQSDDCPPEPLCDPGDDCTADEHCTTGACVQGTCAPVGSPCAPCDSAPDCASPLVCTDGVCTDLTASPCCDVNNGGASLPAGTPCRPATGLCDVAETCTGASPYCPPDALQPADTLCRIGNTDPCDVPDYCTGASGECPDGFRPSGFVCDPISGPCDFTAAMCTGSSPFCGGKTYAPCQPSQGPCDLVDSCTPGFNPNYPACPPDEVAASGTPCTPPAGSPTNPCQAYVCDGTDYACDHTQNHPDGTPCTIGPFDGTCQGGTCVDNLCKYDIDCPDGEICSTSTWHCVPKVGPGQGAQCTGVSGSIFGNCAPGTRCCAGMEGDGLGGYAAAGQTGRCAECCGFAADVVSACDGIECCDGRCVNTDTSERHCGGCTGNSNVGGPQRGADCFELENGCYRNSTCNSGECLFTPVCTYPEVCILPSTPCDPADLFCFGGQLVNPLCTSGWPNFPGCEVTCDGSFIIPASALNAPCDSEADCNNQDLKCSSTCSTRDYGFCFESRTCQPQ